MLRAERPLWSRGVVELSSSAAHSAMLRLQLIFKASRFWEGEERRLSLFLSTGLPNLFTGLECTY